MRDLPILFSAPMVRALLAGTKTQTRRVIEEFSPAPFPGSDGAKPLDGVVQVRIPARLGGWMAGPSFKPPVAAGDRLWVKEKWSGVHTFRDVRPSQRESFTTPDGPVLREDIWYWADGDPTGGDYEKPRPSMFMPRWGSRITLLVEDVRVERLQSISNEDAIAEGIEKEWYPGSDPQYQGMFGWKDYSDHPHAVVGFHHEKPVLSYRSLWETINGEGAWDQNPWVAVYSFKTVLENIDYIGRAV